MALAFLFDLDGVLTDTSEFHYLGWKRLADELGIPFGRKENEGLRGVARRESLQLILGERPVSQAEAAELMERKNNYYLEQVRRMTPANLLPGAVEMLNELRAAGISSGIVSSSKNAPLVVGLLQIGHLVDTVVDGHAAAASKPAPDLFLVGAQRLGLEPARCVVVEDAEAGVQAGIAAGMLTVGLGPRERFSQADLILPSLEGTTLAAILSGLGIAI